MTWGEAIRHRSVVILMAVSAVLSAVEPETSDPSSSPPPEPPPADEFHTAAIDDDIGSDRVGLVDSSTGTWHIRHVGGQVQSFLYGNPGDYPFVGDWNCDGITTPGLYRQSDGFVYLRNSNTQGVADITFFFGNPGDVPIAGDFDDDGCDTVSIYRPSSGQFFIINDLGANGGGLGAADVSYIFGNPGDKPFVGDFDGDGIDTVGLHRESTGFVYFRNSHTQGVADSDFFFGDPGDRLVAGDWGVLDGVDSPAVFRPGEASFYFRHTNTQGNADDKLSFGDATHLPVAGQWGDPPQDPNSGSSDADIGSPPSPDALMTGGSSAPPDTELPPGLPEPPIPVDVAVALDPEVALADLVMADGSNVEASMLPLNTDADFLPQWQHDLGVQRASYGFVSFNSRPGPVGFLIGMRIVSGVVTGGETCSATLVGRRFVITAAHCLMDDNGGRWNAFRFYPAHFPGEAREFYASDFIVAWPAYHPGASNSIYLDYGLVRLTQTNGNWPGDRYGWYGTYTYGTVSSQTYRQGVNYAWDERRHIYGYPTEGWFGLYSRVTNLVPSVRPWVCSSSDGALFNGGGGWWLFATGCVHAGGMSGGPIFAVRNGEWKVIGVNSSGQWNVRVSCGQSNWPYTYPCLSSGSRNVSVFRNSWAAPLLRTSMTANDFDSLVNAANGLPG